MLNLLRKLGQIMPRTTECCVDDLYQKSFRIRACSLRTPKRAGPSAQSSLVCSTELDYHVCMFVCNAPWVLQLAIKPQQLGPLGHRACEA